MDFDLSYGLFNDYRAQSETKDRVAKLDVAFDAMFGKDVASSPFNQLSERELQTAMMIVRGLKVGSIADMFCISAKTVNSYRYRIFEKLHVNSDVELAIFAIKHKIFDIDELTSSALR